MYENWIHSNSVSCKTPQSTSTELPSVALHRICDQNGTSSLCVKD